MDYNTDDSIVDILGVDSKPIELTSEELWFLQDFLCSYEAYWRNVNKEDMRESLIARFQKAAK